ncbi:ATP-dependent DNA helicase pif1-like [Planococcus citri]|uniref:ATP-dependent DNA helicase pif1-like n=1 Tax=Planococcus citri TaxID=170843 RepID=UPI0031F9E48F
MGNQLSFGGKNIVFSGDFRQIPPVIKYGSKAEILSSSIKFSEVWKHLEILHLSVSQRSINDPSYSEFLLKVGEGKIQETLCKDETLICLNFPNLKIFHSIEDVIDFIYPQDDLQNFCELSKRCILSPTNKNINQINRVIIKERIPGEEIYLYSADTAIIEEKGRESIVNPDSTYLCADFLNKLNEPGVPEHKITVKIGAICILLRNLNFEEGLVNGTKVVIKTVKKFIIEVCLPENENKTFLIPRISFKFSAGDTGVQILRRQFPIKLAYALTINKAQGQTLNLAAIDLRDHVFAHGQLYVALSRVRSSKNICILTSQSKVSEDNGIYTANPVFHELLLT